MGEKLMRLLAATCIECGNRATTVSRLADPDTHIPLPVLVSEDAVRMSSPNGCAGCGGQIQFELEPA